MNPTPNRRWFRFSLRALFAVVTACGLLCVAAPRLNQEYHHWQKEQKIVRTLQAIKLTEIAPDRALGGPPSQEDWERMTRHPAASP
jgi:hypothetical protein